MRMIDYDDTCRFDVARISDVSSYVDTFGEKKTFFIYKKIFKSHKSREFAESVWNITITKWFLSK